VSRDIREAVADAHRREWAFVLAATARVAGDIDLAEECVQDAYVSALGGARDGVPAPAPGRRARRRAIDAPRRDRPAHRCPLVASSAPRGRHG
jgi:RNA polymerase sigma-70 factor (ECF subfamily)